GRAPGAPDVDHDDAAEVVSGGELVTVQGLARQVRSWLALVGRDDGGGAVAAQEADGSLPVRSLAGGTGAARQQQCRGRGQQGAAPHVPTWNLRPFFCGSRCATGSR